MEPEKPYWTPRVATFPLRMLIFFLNKRFGRVGIVD